MKLNIEISLKAKLFFWVALIISSNLYSQNIFLKTSVTNITACDDATKNFMIEVRNLNTTKTLQEVIVNSQMLNGIFMVQNLSAGIPLHSSSTVSNPAFFVGSIAPLSTKTIVFSVKADCKIIEYIKTNNIGDGIVHNTTYANYKVDNINQQTFYEPNGSESFNVSYAELKTEVSMLDRNKQATNGETIIRNVIITNTGTGAIGANGISVTVTNDKSGTQFVEVSGIPFTIVKLTDEYTLTISNFSSIGNGNNLFEPGESITLIEKIKVLSCDNNFINTNYQAKWGCNAGICNLNVNNAQDGSSINIISGNPILSITMVSNPLLNYCDGAKVISFKVKNNALKTNDEVKDRSNRLRSSELQLYSGNTSIVNLGSFKILNKAGQYIPITPSTRIGNYIIFKFSSLTSMANGVKGLDDIDGNGTYDDLMPGEEISFSFEAGLLCPSFISDFNINTTSYYFSGPQIDVTGTNTCEEYNYASNYDYSYDQSYLVNQEISGPTDLISGQSGQYLFNIDRTVQHKLDCSSNEFKSVIKFPSYLKVTNVKWVGTNTSTTSFTQSLDGTLTVLGGGFKGNYQIDVTVDCSLATTLGSSDIMSWNMYYNCSGACCIQNIARTNYEIYNHCSGTGGGGSCLRTSSFNVERTTFGYPQPTLGFYNTLPAKLTRSQVSRLDAGMEGDQILAVAKGEAYGIFDNAHVQVQYTSPQPSELLSFSNGYFIVTKNGVQNTYPITSSPVKTNSGSIYYLDFRLDGYSGEISTGMKIDFYGNFKINKIPGLSSGEYLIPKFRAFHYGISENVLKGCESFGANFKLVKVLYTAIDHFHSTDFGCKTPLDMRGIMIAYGIGSSDPFPGEFRPNTRVNEFVVQVPKDFRYKDGSAYFRAGDPSFIQRYLGSPKVKTNSDGSSELTWDQMNISVPMPIFDVFNPNAGSNSIEFVAQIEPICFKTSVNSFNAVTKLNYSNYLYDDPSIENLSFSYSKPSYKAFVDLAITSNPLQDGFTDKVTWPVGICLKYPVPNYAYVSSIDNTWMTFNPPSNINLISATRNGVPLAIVNYDPSHPERKMIKVGPVSNSGAISCANILLTASYTNCKENVTDNIEIKTGYGCSAYPTDPTLPNCIIDPVSSILQLRYKNGAMQSNITKVNTESNLCEPIPYEAELTSSGVGNMQDIQLFIELPTGVTLLEGTAKYEYPSGSGTWNALPTSVPITYGTKSGRGWNLSASALANAPFTPSSKIKIRYDLEAGCTQNTETNLDPGIPVIIYSKGRTNCQDDVFLPFQSKIEIKGFSISGQDLIPSIVTPDICADKAESIIDISITNPGTVPSKQQELVMVLENNLKYKGVPPGSPAPKLVIPLFGKTHIYWTLEAGIPAGGRVDNYKIIVSLGSKNLASVKLETRTRITGSGICTSTNESCPLIATTGQSVRDIIVKNGNCSCPVPTVTITSACPGEETKYEAAFTENSDNIEFFWNFGDGVTSSLQNPTHIYNLPGIYTVKLNFCETKIERQVSIEKCGEENCSECIPSFSPVPEEKYVLSAWIKESITSVSSYQNAQVALKFEGADQEMNFKAKGMIIEGWQRIESEFIVPKGATAITVELKNTGEVEAFFDDIRIHPFNSNMKSFVYDPVTLRLMAELDENNYATYYEYDEEGALVRVKKETERGVVTIQESRNNISKK